MKITKEKEIKQVINDMEKKKKFELVKFIAREAQDIPSRNTRRKSVGTRQETNRSRFYNKTE